MCCDPPFRPQLITTKDLGMNNKTLPSPELAIIYARCDGLIRLVAIVTTATFWLAASVILLALYLHSDSLQELIGTPLQAVSALGLSPIALCILTWRIAERGCGLFLDHYMRSHLRWS